MTPSTEWPASDQGNVATPDLFGGELFGDELIDMYNADAVVGNDDGGKFQSYDPSLDDGVSDTHDYQLPQTSQAFFHPDQILWTDLVI